MCQPQVQIALYLLLLHIFIVFGHILIICFFFLLIDHVNTAFEEILYLPKTQESYRKLKNFIFCNKFTKFSATRELKVKYSINVRKKSQKLEKTSLEFAITCYSMLLLLLYFSIHAAFFIRVACFLRVIQLLSSCVGCGIAQKNALINATPGHKI